jgi:hypothetical protein
MVRNGTGLLRRELQAAGEVDRTEDPLMANLANVPTRDKNGNAKTDRASATTAVIATPAGQAT